MIFKIAIASSDGVRTDRHFGQADEFYIYSLDTEKEDCELLGKREVCPACHGGEHQVGSFDDVLAVLTDVSAIVAQRVGYGAESYLKSHGKAVYQIPLDIEEALCILLEEKRWEADKWQLHTKN